MAIFERDETTKVLLDDTEPLKCAIEGWRIVSGHTEFIICVTRQPFSNQTWHIYKRYNEFHKLYKHFRECGVNLQFPPKKFIGNMAPDFLKERQRKLQQFLDDIIMNPILVSSLPARSFVDPVNYMQAFGERALHHVTVVLRGDTGWELIGPLPEIGWRLRKHYYHVKPSSKSQHQFHLHHHNTSNAITSSDNSVTSNGNTHSASLNMNPSSQSGVAWWASWVDYGPERSLSIKEMTVLMRWLVQLNHTHIESPVMAMPSETGALIVRRCHMSGTLRDYLCGVKPNMLFLKKYGSPKARHGLTIAQIRYFGRQILNTIKFMQDIGLPYGHLHPGNVIIVDPSQQNCSNDEVHHFAQKLEGCIVKLLDVENGLLGVPSFYRPYLIQHRKINTLEAADVYCFGQTLYEMAFGEPLQDSTLDTSLNCDATLKTILESILSLQACKSALPSLDSLIKNDFFSPPSLPACCANQTDCGRTKIPTAVRQHLKDTLQQAEERLKEEQRMVRNQKRMAKIQERMSSEEEKRKQLHHKLQKQEQKQLARERQKSFQERERPVSVDSALLTMPNTTYSALSQRLPSPISDAPAPPPPPPLPSPVPLVLSGQSSSDDGCSITPVPTNLSDDGTDRNMSALLNAICRFDRSSLKKAKAFTS